MSKKDGKSTTEFTTEPVTRGDVQRISEALRELVRATTAERLEVAALRRVLEKATGYEHPEHARLRRLHEKAAEAPAAEEDSDLLACLREENGYLKIANEELRATNRAVKRVEKAVDRASRADRNRRGGVA